MNALARETSPYLLQHAENPVEWHPWGPEALEKARREDKPIFLSIGYSACHWCHVMAHESFEDPATAEVMNRHFVNIKVDREERPDLDAIYMKAVMMVSGSGGWPMSVWLTPDLKPFFGGTYFPPEPRYGRPSFRMALEGVARTWRERRGEVEGSAAQLAEAIREEAAAAVPAGALSREPVSRACQGLKPHFDAEFGGFGQEPKFPPSMDLNLLMREYRRTGEASLLKMVETTLDRMARGGMFDQLGGGFHRYSTDDRWLIPHFEKMLYDNALLVRTYVQAAQLTGNPGYAWTARACCDYVLREMTAPEGGFYSAQDADSEGEEGRFFVWSPAEVKAVLGEEDGDLFCRTYGVTAGGNFEHTGKSALWLPEPLGTPELACRMAGLRQKLLAEREKRVKPGRDEKILADWNGLMIRALAEAGVALDEPRYLDAALKAAGFCLAHMKRDGRLLHTWGRGEARLMAYLDDYAFLAAGCLALLEATGQGRWLMEALDLSETLAQRFADPAGGGFFFTADDHETLIARGKHPGDNALPSGNSVAAEVFLRLAVLTGDAAWRGRAEGILKGFAAYYGRHPRGFAEMLAALDMATAEPVEIVVTGDREARGPLLREVRRRFLPAAVVLPFDPASPAAVGMAKAVPMLANRGLVDGKPAAYVCRGGACLAPVTDPAALGRLLDG